MSALDTLLFGYRTIQNALGQLLPNQNTLQFAGGTVTDDPVNLRTIVSLGSAGFYPYTTPPLVASLTWVQQAGLVSGNASATDDTGGGFSMLSPQPADNAYCIHAKVASLPSAPWTATIGFIVDGISDASNYRAGLVLRESSTGKMLVAGLSDQSTGTAVSQWTNATTHVADDYLSTLSGPPQYTTQSYAANNGIGAPIYMRVQNTGSGLLFSRSVTGTVFIPMALSSADGFTPVSAPLNGAFTTAPNQIGVGLGAVSTNTPNIGMRVFSWNVTTP
jgi:hypothetical protein